MGSSTNLCGDCCVVAEEVDNLRRPQRACIQFVTRIGPNKIWRPLQEHFLNVVGVGLVWVVPSHTADRALVRKLHAAEVQPDATVQFSHVPLDPRSVEKRRPHGSKASKNDKHLLCVCLL